MILRSGKTMARWLRNLPPYHFDQTEKLWLAAIVAGVIYVALFAFVPGFENFGWPCLWKQGAGIECAGCGFTRACAALMKTKWSTALHHNPLVFLVVPLVAWKLVQLILGLASGHSLQSVIPRACKRFFVATLFFASLALLIQRISG